MDISISEIEKRIKDSYEITNNVIKNVPNPMVTVRTSTYHHKEYIKDCIEGVLSQKTSFQFEFIIGEDFSSDGTREIVLDYAKKHPDVIRVITADYNVGSRANGRRCMRASRGKYMALCEGDDYWTDAYKLQKQIDFLEKNHKFSMCFHASRRENVKVESENVIIRPKNISQSEYAIENIIENGGADITTNSMVFKFYKAHLYPEWMNRTPYGDLPLKLFLATKGKVGYIDDVMGIYRFMSPNSWTSSMQNIEKRKKLFVKVLRMWEDFNEWSNNQYADSVKKIVYIEKKSFYKSRIINALLPLWFKMMLKRIITKV